MFTGVLPEKWKITRLMIKTRGAFSIIGFILISPHAFLHLFNVFEGINLFGIIAYALMVPLTIISFKTIRREINPRDWKIIQKASYFIYFSLFLHLLLVGDWFDKIIYAIVLTLYINNKLIKEYKK
jgi:DMSO/TMAO reductase YedYZ heme-binding membrane subunit